MLKYFKKAFKPLILSLLLIGFALPASAGSKLDDAKKKGYIAEQANGYLVVISSSAPPEVKVLVSNVNKKRRALYKNLATQTGVSLAEVESSAGKKLKE